MRDLASRLREIVRRPHGATPGAPVRELTYVPGTDPATPPRHAAETLGATPIGPTGSCVVVDRLFEAHRSHGRRPIDAFAPVPGRPIDLFDHRVRREADWTRRVVFFDTETTGLAGGAGTLAFLAGCGWFEADGFHVRQFFLTGAAGERAMLDALADIFATASLLVTYNGRSFDVPLMEMRWAFHRAPAPTGDLPHFDMLPPARRLWSRRDGAGDEGCTLAALERSVLGFHREGDVPGFEIPARYFHFLRTGDASSIEGVLDHNRHDLVSLAGVMAHALWLADEGPDACREDSERVALGRLYERAGEVAKAEHAFERARSSLDAETRRHALSRLAAIFRRSGRHDEAARAWSDVLTASAHESPGWSPLERRAAEALAIHHEHRAKDLASATRYARALELLANGRDKTEVQHRLTRLKRKLHAKNEPGLEFPEDRSGT